MNPIVEAGPQNIRRSAREEGIWILTFDRPGSSANILDLATLRELGEELDALRRQPGVKGLVLASAKPSILIAGADLHAFRAGARLDQVRHYIEFGQELMNRIAALPFPTAAAIHGAALGGGYEICLACDYRVASAERATRIGLPETQLGLLPAWGGSTRLPRLIGLQPALDVITGGKPVPAQRALELGMVDELAAKDGLLDAAIRRLRDGKPQAAAHRGSITRLADAWTRRSVRHDLAQRTRGRYPAPAKALDVVTSGLSLSIEAALAHEREAFLELVQTEACHNLIDLFLLEERAKKRRAIGATEVAEPKPIRRAAVIGAGTMGAGIAHWLSTRQIEVALCDVDAAQLKRGMARIRALYQESVARGDMTVQEQQDGLSKVRAATVAEAAIAADLVVEAAVEDLAVKQRIFARLAEQASLEAILATNTSALPIGELACCTTRPERVLGLHFFNPVHRMQLVEIIAAKQTAPENLDRALRFAQRIGKLPVLVKDSPGFVANRLLTPYLNEAQALFESGLSAERLDGAMLDFGLPMGPLRLLDEIGLDVELRIAETLAAAFAGPMAVRDCLRAMVQAGWLGRKTGRGFYVYDDPKHPRPNPDASALVHGQAAREISREEAQERLLFVMINEAARCLEENIVAGPEDIDFVMVKGAGFPAFRGGVLRYADHVGAERLVGAMEHLADSGEERFAPCGLLRSLAIQRKTFYAAPAAIEHERQAA